MPNTDAKLVPFFLPADPVTPEPGVGSFAALLPLQEPQSAGFPPVEPEMLSGLSVSFETRRVRVRSGQEHSCALPPLSPRPTFTVRWRGLSQADADALAEFLEETCHVGEEGGLLAFNIEPDGPGKGTYLALAVGPARRAEVDRRIFSVEVECEQVW